MPYVRGMFVKAKQMFDSDYYGYINSDILLPVTIFNILSMLNHNRVVGTLSSNVRVSFLFVVVRNCGTRFSGE